MPTGRESRLAFRQRRQHLDRRLPPARLAEVAAACCGLRNSPPGSDSAALAVFAAAEQEAARLAPLRSCTTATMTVG